MKKTGRIVSLLAVLIFLGWGIAFAGVYQYEVEHPHAGGDATPAEAYAMLQKDPAHTFLVDVRTQAEYEFIGHPAGACNIPIKFLTTKMGEKGYELVANSDFEKDLLARFNPQTDTLIFLCRSGSRSCAASDAAIKAGWPAEKVINMMGGFEGGKLKSEGSAYNGQRIGGSWRNEGLPWTYHMEAKLVYQPDLAAH